MTCVFVILHYLTLTDTLESVDSIKCFESESQIVVVDNASNNGSLEELIKKYQNDGKVDVISSPDNIGFARGNNLGIRYARDHYSPDFICLMNNDALLIESILPAVEAEYEYSNFAALGPMIYTADGRCDDNPGTDHPMSKEELEETISYVKRMLLIDTVHMRTVYNTLGRIKRKILRQKEVHNKPYLKRNENVQLHGSFLVLSRHFFEHFQGLYPETFLNMEEDILFWQLYQKNLTSVYLPCIHIFHKEDSASKKVWSNDRKRAIAKSKNILYSARAFERLMRECGKEPGNKGGVANV